MGRRFDRFLGYLKRHLDLFDEIRRAELFENVIARGY